MKRFAIVLLPLLLLLGCYTGYENAVVQDEVDGARQQQILDSLAKVNEFELRKNRSFAHEYYKQQNYTRARDYFLKQMELDVTHQYNSDYARLADCYIRLNNADSARIAYQTALENDPENVYMHFALGHLEYTGQRLESAMQHFKFVTEKEPANPKYLEAWLKIKAMYVDQEDYDKVIGVLDRLIELYPDNMEYSMEKDNILAQYFDPEQIIASLEESHSRFPDDVDISRKLIRAYYDNTDYEKALTLINQVLQMDGGATKQCYMMQADTYEALQQLDSAISSLKKVVDMDGSDVEVIVKISDLYRQKKSFQAARSWVYRAYRIENGNAHATYVLGLIYENTADECVRGGIKFDDKLVYKLAREQFSKITQDPRFGKKARNRMTYLEEFIPKKEDLFMNQGKDKPSKECYQWIYE